MRHKPTLFIIIILLLIFIPASIFGISKKSSAKEEEKVELTYAGSTLNEIDNNVNTYKNGSKIYLDNFTVNNKEYNFVKLEDNKTWLYSVKDNIKVLDYDAINFYNTDIENGYVLVKRQNKWGILNTKTLKPVVPCEYDYIGFIDNVKNNELQSNTFIGAKNNSYSIYKITDTINAISNSYSNIIYTYNENLKILSTMLNDYYMLYDFAGNRVFADYNIKDIALTDNFITLIDSNGVLYVYKNIFSNAELTEIVNSYKEFYASESNGKLQIYIDGTLYKTIEK